MVVSVQIRKRALRTALCLSTILVSSVATLAAAQTADTPEQFRNNDEHGVDLTTGTYNPAIVEAAIGDQREGIALMRYWGRSGWRDNWSGDLRVTGSSGSQTATITFGGVSEKFTQSGSNWINAKANGGTLTSAPGPLYNGVIFTYTSADGSKVTYSNLAALIGSEPQTMTVQMASIYCNSTNATDCALPTQITKPNGASYALTWYVPSKCTTDQELNETCNVAYRLADVRSKNSFGMKISYASSSWPTNSPAPATDWTKRSGAKFFDLSQVYCDAAAASCDTVTATKSVTYATPSAGVFTVTNEKNESWRYAFGSGGLTGIRRPGQSSDTTTIGYDTSARVTSITENGATKSYSWTVGSTTTVSTSTGGGESGTVVSTPAAQQPVSETNGTSNTTTITYDSAGRKTRETRPEGDYTNYTYDARGNLTETRIVAKSSSGLADIVATASFDSSCANEATCNQPNYQVDANGNRTDYTYDTTHGGVTRVQMPAPVTSGTRPEVNYAYTALYPQVRDSSNALVSTSSPVYKLTQVTQCATAATCSGTANETKVSLAYATPNLQLTSVTVASGDGAISSTTAYTYDAAENLKTVDGPLSGSDDTTTYFYDTYNRLRGIIGGDPDGSGSLPRPAERYTLDGESRITRKERGYATAATDSALDAMTVTDVVDVAYDANGNVTSQTLKSGSTSYSLTQFSYDADNRLVCTAVRMNTAVYGSLPSDACTASTLNSAVGPDRITKNTYDANGRVTKVQTAYGQTEQADEVAATYTANGQVATLKDAEANLTTFEYNGVDRLSKRRFPVSTKGSNSSSTTDYEQLTYDANGNVLTKRTRANETLTYTYDALNRLTVKAVPERSGLSSTQTRDVYFGYDLASRLISARFDSASGEGITNAFDALGRVTSSTQAMDSASRALSYQYDASGNRTRLTFPDSNYIALNYDALSRFYYSTNNGGGGINLAYYDSAGRPSSIYRWNASTGSWAFQTGYAYNAWGGVHDWSMYPASSSYSFGKSFNYNPAGQIIDETRYNDTYAWTGHVNVDRNYTANGLNQYTAAGSASFSYDANGNLTSDGTNTYMYDVENRLVAKGSTTLRYDPLGRLYEIYDGTNYTRLLHDGDDLVAEYNGSGTMLRRFVHGTNAGDDPLVWFEGSGVGDSARRNLYADERGSVIAVTDSAGAMIGVNRYDEYGIPQSTNIGRFQYTGQAWLPELGMYYYKARMYSPTLGRFMQIDPIGYGDGLNWHNYVHGDPVNGVDASGLVEEIIVIGQRQTPRPSLLSKTKSVIDVKLSQRPGMECDDVCEETRAMAARFGSMNNMYGGGDGGDLPQKTQANPVPADYCGSKGSEGVPDVVWGGACKRHDDCYGTPGNSKAVCDIKLGRDIIRECTRRTYGYGAAWCVNVALVYSSGLLLLGVTPWYHPSRDAYDEAQKTRVRGR
ncbi:RHS repeat domain-containing protein [Parablastomonas sp. CN1-191]|uniref:RHS repeat domain-containing protein n=1 Tax=Parablastomonas sp. CN1-191 TaxID=3400908 RepID=UPI003BF7D5CE